MPTWDDRIDEAARQLTSGRPGPGFRTKVLARLDEPPRRWSRAWLLAPAAAAAIIVLAVVQPREESGEVAAPIAPVAEKTEPGATSQPTDAGLKAGASSRLTEAGLKAGTISTPVTSVEFETDLAVAPIELAPVTVPATIVQALDEPEPISVEGLTIEALETINSGQ